ncbi:MAG: hypothetical protein HN576_08360 [Bacteriovoracaceae bacterium]|jgi:hypothetical protein|nr:hypothetical protein [Bacteriovoracaceae bacterium]
MKLILTILLFTSSVFASDIKFNQAPFEWLISQAMLLKTKETLHGHDLKQDQLIQEILEVISYDNENDHLILSSNMKLFRLREKLLDYIQSKYRKKPFIEESPLFQKWNQESEKSLYTVELLKNLPISPGHYVFNHVHTNISQDNPGLKLFKMSPAKTLKIYEKYLKKRNTKGVVHFTDHDTDIAYKKASVLANEHIGVQRGIEWGGSTHMCLVGIKENWDLLGKGRTFRGEESIIQSRSSKGFRIINHPNARKTPFKYTSWLDADGVEVWNTILENAGFISAGKLNPSNNMDALKQWADSLKIGKRYTAMSGTDFHFNIPCVRDHIMMYPSNFIPTTDISKSQENLFRGNTSILMSPIAPKLNLRAKFASGKKWSKMGEELIGRGELLVELDGDLSDTRTKLNSSCYNTVRSFYRLLTSWKKRFWEIRFYNLKGDVIAKKILFPSKLKKDKSFTARIKIPITDKEIVRAEIWRINKKSKSVDLIGITNPIYLNRE